jgi:hypothetical protein
MLKINKVKNKLINKEILTEKIIHKKEKKE